MGKKMSPVSFQAILGGTEARATRNMKALTFKAAMKPERLTSPAQTKLTPSEFERLEKIRDLLNDAGIGGVTISSLLRTFAVHGLRVAEEELGVSQ